MQWLILYMLVYLSACGDQPSSELNSSDTFVNIMPKAEADYYKSLLPKIEHAEMQEILANEKTMWYDHNSIIPGYQDSFGDPEGMRPNTIQSILIDLAVPGGHQRLFAKRGKFNFPFMSGGADRTDNMVKINFWSAPIAGDGSTLPVIYWVLNFSRWQWLFPKGTVLGEVLMIRSADNSLTVFEIRARKRLATSWQNFVFRPFPTATDLASAVQAERPDWQTRPNLNAIVNFLLNKETLKAQTLESQYFPKAFEKVMGFTDVLPDFTDPDLVKNLLSKYVFRSANDHVWKQDGNKIAYAATTSAAQSIVPRKYDAALLAVNDESCQRCHKDAGRQIGHFHDELIAYGELWGEDEIFSWHPFENNMFVDSNGDVKNFNDDNRRLRKDFSDAKLVALYNPNVHTEAYYQRIPRDWQYGPIFKGE